MNFIEIRRGTQVLILARPGVLPRAARAANDRQRLPGALARLSQDKSAMAVLRANWFNVFPSIINIVAMSDMQVGKYVTDALASRRVEAALLRDAAVPLSLAEVEQMQHAFANARVQRGQIIVAQAGRLPAEARSFTNRAQVVQLLGAMQDSEEGAITLDRQAGRLSAFGVGALRGRTLRNGIIAQLNQRVLDGAYIPPGMVADAAGSHPSAGGSVASMGPGDKVATALQRSLPHLSGEVRALVAEMVTPTNLAIMAGVFVAVALANTNPVTGAAVDSILLGIAWFAAGLTGVYALGDFIDATVSAIKAKTEPELDEAGRTYAKALVGMGSALIQAIMARFLSKRGGTAEEGAGAGKTANGEPSKGQPSAKEPAPAQKPVQYGTRSNATEPGARPPDGKTMREIQRAKLRGANGTMTKPGWSDIPGNQVQTFKAYPEPVDLPEGTKIYRVVDAGSNPNGMFWTTENPAAMSEAQWRAGAAVRGEWNGDGAFVEHTVPKGGLKVWSGEAAPQMSSDGINVLSGGGNQLWIAQDAISATKASPPISTGWGH